MASLVVNGNGTTSSAPARPTSPAAASPDDMSVDLDSIGEDDVEDLRARARAAYESRSGSNDYTAKNRRKRYLDLHPEYFGAERESADPLMYDRYIRRFQTAAEREKEARNKGHTGTMYADLMRDEAKRNALNNPNAIVTYKRGPGGEILPEEPDEIPKSKEEGFAWFKDEMTQRFLAGRDYDFDYRQVDQDTKYDDPEEDRDIVERYFDDVAEDWDSDGEGAERILTGETGIQDY